MWFLLASLAHGGEIQVVPLVPIEIIVDGLPVPMDANGVTMTVAGLAGGKHTVEARNAFGKTQAWKEVDLAADEQLRFEYRQKELWHVATTKLVAAPLAVAASSEVVVVQPGMPGAGVSIAVDDGMGGSVVMGADAWGGGGGGGRRQGRSGGRAGRRGAPP
jgi:hypothetical protein